MDYTGLTELLTNVGFPIVVCFYLYKFITAELASLKESLNGMTDSLNKVDNKLDVFISLRGVAGVGNNEREETPDGTEDLPADR